MASSRQAGWDGVALTASVLAAAVAGGYVWLMLGYEHDEPVAWFLAGLIVSALLSAYGADPAARGRTAALVISGTILVVLGALGIFTIGLPIIAIGALALVASARARDRART